MAIPHHIIIWIAGDINFPGFDWKHNCLFLICCFPELPWKFFWLSWRSWLSLTYTVYQSYVGVINVLDLFITTCNDSLIVKTRVIQGIIDHDAVFVEGINIKATLNKQKHRMVSLYRKSDWDALKNTCRLCRAFYYLWSVNKWLFVVKFSREIDFWYQAIYAAYKHKKICAIGSSTIPLTICHLCTCTVFHPFQLQMLVSLSYYRQPKATQGHWAWWSFSHSPLGALSLVIDNPYHLTKYQRTG